MELPGSDAIGDDAPMKKRRRGPHACSLCRQRKVKCDGNQPCSNCDSADAECVYGSEPASKGKSDAILETVLRLEDRLSHITGLLLDTAHQPLTFRGPGSTAAPTVPDKPLTAALSPRTTISTDPSLVRNTKTLVQDSRRDERRLENAALSSQHTSTTESVLAWSYFDSYPGLRTHYRSIFTLEQQRSNLVEYATEDTPILGAREVREITSAFQAVVNFSYPTVSSVQISDVEQRMIYGRLDHSIETCYAFLIMALGCASQAVITATETQSGEPHDRRYSRSRDLALIYFGLVVKRFHVIQLQVSTAATQCLFFIALFFAYLQRPLQAWSHISMAAAKCRLLLSYTSADAGTDTECLRRVFWSCYILESDYIAELAALPQSGVGDMESSVPFPGFYPTAEGGNEEEKSSLYFLACVSMRRLLNRVHDLLYAPDTGVGFDDARFPHVVTELDHQLEEWRACLPPAFAFTVDTEPTTSAAGGFLRQRYLTCRAVIHRPYLNVALSKCSIGESVPLWLLDESEVCLAMCLLHILNLRAFRQTVLIDTWICSLSMASTMLILLAASRVPQLKQRIRPEVLQTGSHLSQLLESWLHLHGDQASPSVEQSLRMIAEVHTLIKREHGCSD